MSMWDLARNATKSYLTRLNAGVASRLVTGGWRAGYMSRTARAASHRTSRNVLRFFNKRTMGSATEAISRQVAGGYFGARGAAEGARRWVMRGNTMERVARMGTIAAGGIGAVGTSVIYGTHLDRSILTGNMAAMFFPFAWRKGNGNSLQGN